MTETVTAQKSIAAQVLEIISRDYADGRPVAESESLTETLGMDSLDIAELAMALDDHFRVDISDEEIDTWRTVGDVVAVVERMADK